MTCNEAGTYFGVCDGNKAHNNNPKFHLKKIDIPFWTNWSRRMSSKS